MMESSATGLDLTSSRADEVGWSPIDVPLDLGVGPDATARLLSRVTWGFIGLGVLIRVVRYLVDFPIWGDEAFLAASFIDRGYLDLMRPLDFGQVSPLLFLWIEHTAVLLFGFSEWSLRLFPTVAGIASLFLFRHMAGRVVGEFPKLLAVAILSVGLEPIRRGGDIKPYTTDLIVAMALLAMAIEWLRDRGNVRWFWAMAAFVPFGLGLSHPAVFAASGIAMGLAPSVWKTRRRETWIAFGAYNLALAGGFGLLYVLFTGEQSRDVIAGMRKYWDAAFPPLQSPGKLVVWLIQAHTGHMFSYPVGDKNGGSTLTAFCFALAAVALWKRGRKPLVAISVIPFALAFIAAVPKRYPYGGSARTMMFLTPAIILLAGLGLAIVLSRLPRASMRRRAVRLTLAGFTLLGLGLLGHEVARPYNFLCDLKVREFSRWFWTERARDAELVCVKTDLKTVFIPKQWKEGRGSIYLCLQKIYSDRHRRNGKPKLEQVSASRPLRCVFYHEPSPARNPQFAAWMADMKSRYDLRNREEYFIGQDRTPVDLLYSDRFIVYEFVPRADASPMQVASGSERLPQPR